MKSKIVLFFILISTGKVHAEPFFKKLTRINQSKSAKKYEKITELLIEKKFYFSAIDYAKEHLKNTKSKTSTLFDKSIDQLVSAVGINTFMDMQIKHLAKTNSAAVKYIIAKKYYEDKKFELSIKYLDKVYEGHRFHPESLFLSGTIQNLMGKDLEAIDRFMECVDSAADLESESSDVKVKRFYRIIKERCTFNIARVYYKTENYRMAYKYYYKIDKKSYIWPYVLMEIGWTSYNLEDFNKTLGVLVTYKSPLLESYFFPESEILSALSYLELCLWTDALMVVKKFHEYYAPQSDALYKLIKKYKNSNTFYFDLMFDPKQRRNANNPNIKKLVNQIRKRIYFNFQLNFLKKSAREYSRLGKLKKYPLARLLRGRVKKYSKNYKFLINKYIRGKMYYFVNEMNRLSEEMYNIQLEAFARKKDVLYESKKAEIERLRGNYSNVKRTTRQFFWDFRGGFWADELGDYVFGLESSCKKERQKGK